MICGFGLTFILKEITGLLFASTNPTSILFLQKLGPLYLGFGMLNWMTKNNLIGGIYSKPLVIGNLAQFLMTTITLIKIIVTYSNRKFIIILSLTIVYAMFTAGFRYVFNKNPNKSFNKN